MSLRVYRILVTVLLPGIVLIATSQYILRSAEERIVAIRVIRSGSVWPADVEGNWEHNGRRCALIVGPEQIDAIDEFGAKAPVELTGHTVVVRAWELKGEISSDYKKIVWSDGAIWSRK